MPSIVIDYTATALNVHKGATPELPTKFKRATIDNLEELSALDKGLLLRIGNHVMGTNAETFPEGGEPMVWDSLEQMPEGTAEFVSAKPETDTSVSAPVKADKPKKNGNKAEKKSAKKTDKPLQSAPDDGKSSAPGNNAGVTTERKMANKATKKAAKKKVAAKKKTATKKNGAKKVSTGARGEKTLKVKALLMRKSGCTRKDILDATGWPSVSVQQMAKATSLKLRKEKEPGSPTVYFGTEK